MTNKSEYTTLTGALGGPTNRRPALLDLPAFLGRAVTSKRPVEGWVESAVLYAVEKSGITHFQLADPGEDCPDRAVWAALPEASKAALYAAVGAIYPPVELEGCELCLRLQAERSGDEFLITVIDIERRALDAAVMRRARDSRRALVEFGYFQRQNDLPEPDVIRRVEVIHALDDFSWPAMRARLDALAPSGLGYAARAVEMNGISGFMALTNALENLSRRAADDGIDVALILADESGCCPALAEIDTALPVCAMPAHVVVGMPRGSSESLLHAIAFAGCDSPADAITVLEDLVRHVRGSAQELRPSRVQ
jgi:hypothetical protein